MLLVACGGGGGGSSSLPGASASATPAGDAVSSVATLAVNNAGTTAQSLPSVLGITGTLTLPHVSASSGTSLSVQLSTGTPTGSGPTLQTWLAESTADDICSLASYACPNGSVQEGHGRLDVYRAVGGLLGLDVLRAATSIGTAPAPSPAVANAVFRRRARRTATPQTSSSLLYVHYSLSALRSAGRGVADVERATGIVRSTRLRQSSADDELHVVRIPGGESIDAFASKLRAQAGVRSVEAVHLRQAL